MDPISGLYGLHAAIVNVGGTPVPALVNYGPKFYVSPAHIVQPLMGSDVETLIHDLDEVALALAGERLRSETAAGGEQG